MAFLRDWMRPSDLRADKKVGEILLVEQGCLTEWRQGGLTKSHRTYALWYSVCVPQFPAASLYCALGNDTGGARGEAASIERSRVKGMSRSWVFTWFQGLGTTHSPWSWKHIPHSPTPSSGILRNLGKALIVPQNILYGYYGKVAPAKSKAKNIKIIIKVESLWKRLCHFFLIED